MSPWLKQEIKASVLMCVQAMKGWRGSRGATYSHSLELACEQQLHLYVSWEFSITIEFCWGKKPKT